MKNNSILLIICYLHLICLFHQGGLPYWLFTKYPDIKPRTSDERYLNEVKIWFDKLLPMLVPHLIGNGGPIIMVQVENEYGGYGVDDQTYLLALRDQMRV